MALQGNVLRFYANIPTKDVPYLFDDIVKKWDDYKLQVRENYINWLFPSAKDENSKLTARLLYKFRTNSNIRYKVVQATLRMMLFYGYSINVKKMVPIKVKDIKRQENNTIVGFYNTANYPRITHILEFLVICNMPELSAIFFLMICMAIKEHPDLQKIINDENIISKWVKTQKYLIDDRYKVEESLGGMVLEDWEKTFEEPAEEVNKDAWSEEN